MATQIHHWKHGWIPLDNFARQIKEGKVQAPGAKGSNPSLSTGEAARYARLPKRIMPDHGDKAVEMAAEMQTLVPGLTTPRPEVVSHPSMNTHATGGLIFSPAQADAVIAHMDTIAEGYGTLRTERKTVGKPLLRGTYPEQLGKDRARLLNSSFPNYEGAVALAHIDGHGLTRLPRGAIRDEPNYTGGIVVSEHGAQALLDKLRYGRGGMPTVRQARIAAGRTPDPRRGHPPNSLLRPKSTVPALPTATPRAIGR